MEESIKRLWIAANSHCCMMCGQYIDTDFEPTETEADPPLPSSVEKVLELVAQYLEDAI